MPTTDNIDASPAAGAPRFGPPTTANPFWRIVVIGGAAFGLSCLLWLTAGYANPDAPGNQWLNRHGLKLVVVTASAAVVSAIAAMATDRWQTARMNPGNVNPAVDDDADTTELA